MYERKKESPSRCQHDRNGEFSIRSIGISDTHCGDKILYCNVLRYLFSGHKLQVKRIERSPDVLTEEMIERVCIIFEYVFTYARRESAIGLFPSTFMFTVSLSMRITRTLEHKYNVQSIGVRVGRL